MTTEEIIQDSYFYHWIMERGEKSGFRKILTQQLTARFGELPQWAVDRVNAADAETLGRWAITLISPGTLEDCLR